MIKASHLTLSMLLLAGCAGSETAQAPIAPAELTASAPRMTGTVRASRAEDLVGRDSKGLRALMGPPTLLRKDHGAQLWQYAGRSCTLLAYLYPNAKGEPEVSYVDARAKTVGAVPVSDCLASLAKGG